MSVRLEFRYKQAGAKASCFGEHRHKCGTKS